MRSVQLIGKLIPTRSLFPISGKIIRKDPFRYREHISPIVYKDLITNVVFLGAPSTGKSTIACKLADEYKTVWMPEYGREYWEKYQVNRRLSLENLVEIAEGHLDRENVLLYKANQYLFTDTNAITTLMFSLNYHQTALPKLIEYANQAQSRYDLVFLCDVDIPYDNTWDRSGDVSRKVFQKQIIGDLLARKIPFILLRGDLVTRIMKVKQVLKRFKKFNSIMDTFIKRIK